MKSYFICSIPRAKVFLVIALLAFCLLRLLYQQKDSLNSMVSFSKVNWSERSDNHVYLRRRSQLAEVFVNDEGELVIPDENVLNQTETNDLQEIYHRYVESIQERCRSQIHLGNEHNGGYHVCEDPEVAPAQPCLVYSFGIQRDFSFDDAIVQRFGCEVHSFDPSMGVKDHKHSESVSFHSIGIGGTNMITSDGWNLKTLGTIRKELHHDMRRLDILKVDVEGTEFSSLPEMRRLDILKVDVEGTEFSSIPEMVNTGSIKDFRQLIVEFHVTTKSLDMTSRNDYISHLTLLRKLYKLGFRIFYFRMWNDRVFQGGGVKRTPCHEVHFMRLKG